MPTSALVPHKSLTAKKTTLDAIDLDRVLTMTQIVTKANSLLDKLVTG